MRRALQPILITGGAGFIGSAFLRLAVDKNLALAVCDKLTYAADLARLKNCKERIAFFKVDVGDYSAARRVFLNVRPKTIVHFAAATHVDRSIKDSSDFVQTNYLGTYNLLELSRRFGVERFVHISTDEVYGQNLSGSFSEDSPLQPNSPYAATKAAADLLIRAFIHTHNFPAIIIRPCNNYGPWQYPEKFIPLAILRILRGEKIPIYGRGENVREWLYVDDCAKGILQILGQGRVGEVYNLGSGERLRNIDTARIILKAMGRSPDEIEFVSDRPGHDLRYCLDSSKTLRQIGFRPKTRFKEGIVKTIHWSIQNKDWLLDKWIQLKRLYPFLKTS